MAELVAKRYGTALFELAIENKQVDDMELEVKAIMNVFMNEPELLEVLNHPQVTIKNKEKIVEDLFDKNLSNNVLGLINLTIKKGRQNMLIEIFEYFLEKVNEYNNIIKVSVTSIESLTDTQKNDIVTKIETITNKTVVLEEIIDDSIIGGLIIRIGDRIIDNSIKGQLQAMSKDLLLNT